MAHGLELLEPHRRRSDFTGRTYLSLPVDFCSHWRSWRFFAESLDPSMPPYYALACGSQADFVAGRCAGNEHVVMGYATPNT